MLILVFFLFLLALVHTIVSLSLYESRLVQGIVIALLGGSALVFLPWSIKINAMKVVAFLGQPEVLQTLCTIQIIESLAMMTATVVVMRRHVKHDQARPNADRLVFPNLLTLALVFFATNGLCHILHQWSYTWVAVMVAISIAIILFVGSLGLKIVIRDWFSRLEIKILINFFQIVLAMFLPLMLNQLEVRQSASDIAWMQSGLVLVGMGLVVAIGILSQRFNITIPGLWVGFKKKEMS